jgi:hypothetical protein
MRPTVIGLMASLAFGLPSGGLADDLTLQQRFTETGVGFDLKGDYSNVTLTISGPNGFHASAFAKSGTPSIDLRQADAEDGAYTYQLTASTNEKVQARTQLDNGRDPRATVQPVKSVSTSGTFQVRSGAIVKPDPNVREPQQKRN